MTAYPPAPMASAISIQRCEAIRLNSPKFSARYIKQRRGSENHSSLEAAARGQLPVSDDVQTKENRWPGHPKGPNP